MNGFQYRQTRNYENLQRAMFVGVGPLGIPELEPMEAPPPRYPGMGELQFHAWRLYAGRSRTTLLH